jgi:hypothetical protein
VETVSEDSEMDSKVPASETTDPLSEEE